MVTKVIFVQQR